MQRLRNLKPSITKMTRSDGLQLIEFIRSERVRIKVVEKTKTKRAKKAAQVNPVSIMKAKFKNLTPEQMKLMKERLGL